MLLDEDADRLTDREIANNAAHGFGAAMLEANLEPVLKIQSLTNIGIPQPTQYSGSSRSVYSKELGVSAYK